MGFLGLGRTGPSSTRWRYRSDGPTSCAQPLPITEGLAAALPILLVLCLTDGLGEETGWRGFLLPRQLQHLNRLAASCLLGVIWALWHLPLFWTEGAALAGSSPW